MRVHVLQVSYDDDEPVDVRVARVAAMVAAQHGADLVLLPELWAPGGFAYRTWAERAEPVDGATIGAVAEAARSIGAFVHAGSLVERGRSGHQPSETDGTPARGLWNTSVLLGPDGAVRATYRKIHRFGFGQGEPVLMDAGTEVVTLALPLASGTSDGAADVVVGLTTCYDLRFPELYRRLVDAAARVVLVPAAWPAARVEAWRLLGRARAMENQLVVVQCNTAGTHSGVRMGGYSQVVDARGAVLAEAGPDDEEVLVVDLDLADVEAWRAEFPVLADRRL